MFIIDQINQFLKEILIPETTDKSWSTSKVFNVNNKALDKFDTYLFFIKPECLEVNNNANSLEIVNTITEILKNNKIIISEVMAFNGTYAIENAFVQNQYYTLNKLSNYGLKTNVGIEYKPSEFIGSFRFLELFPDISAKELEEESHKNGSEKLGNGTYVFRYTYNNKLYNILNAFHPYQVEHFSKRENRFVLFLLHTNISPKKLSEEVIGNFNPENALDNSIRSILFKRKKYLSIPISTIHNGVHISPSPLEGARAQVNYFSHTGKSVNNHLIRNLNLDFSYQQILEMFENPDVHYNGENRSLFEVCEGKTTDEILQIVRKVYNYD